MAECCEAEREDSTVAEDVFLNAFPNRSLLKRRSVKRVTEATSTSDCLR